MEPQATEADDRGFRGSREGPSWRTNRTINKESQATSEGKATATNFHTGIDVATTEVISGIHIADRESFENQV